VLGGLYKLRIDLRLPRRFRDDLLIDVAKAETLRDRLADGFTARGERARDAYDAKYHCLPPAMVATFKASPLARKE